MQDLKTELLCYLNRNDLLRAAILIGRVQDPALDFDGYVDKIMGMAAKVWHRTMRAKYDPILKAQAIREVIFKDQGLVGKHEKYKHIIDDPNRFLLGRVLESKVCTPLTLTVLFQVLSDQVGLEVECVSLPNLYLLRVRDTTTEFYVDPFDQGNFLSVEDFQRKLRSGIRKNRMISTNLFEILASTELIVRLLQQLKHCYILKGKALEALRTVELMATLFPEEPEHTRDRGILYCEMEYFSKAIHDLQSYLDQCPEADDVKEIKKLASMLRGYHEVIN